MGRGKLSFTAQFVIVWAVIIIGCLAILGGLVALGIGLAQAAPGAQSATTINPVFIQPAPCEEHPPLKAHHCEVEPRPTPTVQASPVPVFPQEVGR